MSHKIFRLFLVLFVVVGLVTLQAAQPARAAGPWYVAPTGDDNNDCLSPGTACATINGAIGKASPGDTINVSLGTYTGNGNEVVLIERDITLNGGWNASFTNESGVSTIDGQDLRRGMTINNGVTATVERFMLQNGNVTGDGAGIRNAGVLTISDSIIANNIAGNGSGAGIYNADSGVLNLNNSTLNHNGSNQLCWTVTNYGTFTMHSSVVEENTTTTIYCAQLTILNAGNMTLVDTAVRNNLGGIYNYATLTLNNSSVSGNVGSDGPGGIYNWGGSLTVTNSTISGNATTNGGGIFAGGGGTVRLNNDTITANTATYTYGGGIYNLPNSPAQIVMQNTILAGNSTAGSGPDCNGMIGSSGYNVIGNLSNCSFSASTGDLTDTDPFLGPLQDNGGSTFTHALLPQSPAIDAGNVTGCTDQNGNPLITDQRGVTRPQGIGCDIGAYEYVFTTPGPAASIAIVSGSGQVTDLDTAFSKPLKVVALDDQGNRVSGVTVTFTAPASGPSGTFANSGTFTSIVDTDAGGVATASVFTANNQAGDYIVTASAAGLGAVNFSLTQVDRPANDNFANAEVILALPFNTSVDITNATNESGEPQLCFSVPNTVWYSFTPSTSGAFRADMSGSSFADTVLNIYKYTGSGITGLDFVNCNIDLSNGGSTSLSAQAGITYYFQAGSYNGGSGELHLNLQAIPNPQNDNFASATVISSPLPFDDTVDTVAATLEEGEPVPSCAPSGLFSSVWYAYTPITNGLILVSNPSNPFTPVLAAYTGSSLTGLTEVRCRTDGYPMAVAVTAGTTYYFQAAGLFDSGQGGPMQFHIEVAPPPAASFTFDPFDPSAFDTIGFCDSSFDPGQFGFQSFTWDFGDHTVISTTNLCVFHQYAADGDYTVQHSATTVDGRTASTSQVIHVRTHDVAITKIAAPNSANVGQTKSITVNLRNKAYPETVQLDLYKSTSSGFIWIARVTQSVSVLSGNRTTAVNFNYTFTSDDARLGKVVFKAVATIIGARDVLPADNAAISSPPTKVGR